MDERKGPDFSWANNLPEDKVKEVFDFWFKCIDEAVEECGIPEFRPIGDQ